MRQDLSDGCQEWCLGVNMHPSLANQGPTQVVVNQQELQLSS